ncbi:MAG: NAD(P)/FAD-dependent oxidoreductase, partial [Synergistales bacterium]|nr:NAD(P)/FAD-dependent oxidoreductase [Synergistales bacterium]
MTSEADVAIVGAGVVGCAVARELARYRLSVCVVEKEADVGWGTSCRNSGVVHSGINYRPGTLRARLDVRGNELMAPLCRELRVPMQRIGKLTVAGCTAEIPELHRIREQGEANGVPGLELIGPGAMRRIQPGVEGVAALHSPSSGIVCPYSLTIALAENALRGGAAFRLESEVTGIHRGPGGFTLQTTSGDVSAPVVINAAGLGADRVAAMAGIDGYRHYPCRGEYYVLDRRLAGSVATLIYPAPRVDSPGLGIHLTPTVEGNILIGPSSEYVGEREDCATTRQVMASLREHGRELLPGLSMRDFIRSFAGVRPKQTPPEVGGNRDFVIEESPDCPGLINLIGIESPGLTASPAIAEMVREMVAVHLPLEADEGFVP